jgi:mono/diheme cytochrome c family protein
MTRATRAKWLAGMTAAIVVLLVAVFAALRNQPVLDGAAPAPAGAAEAGAIAPLSTAARGPTSAGVDATRLARGRSAYDRLQCAACHSIAGRGNPANPLDGVGTRLDRNALHDFATGTGAAQGPLGSSLARRKSRALEDPELGALLDYLAQLQ